MDQPTTLKRELNLLEVTLSGTGIILGAGVYVLIGDAAALAGNAVWLSFALAALIAAFTALSYAELSSMFPTAGAEYDYVAYAFHQRLAFIVGIMVILSGVVGAAAVSVGFAGYFSSFTSLPLVPVAAVLLIGLAVLNSRGIQESTNVAIVLTLIEAGGLIGIIAIGLPHLGSINYFEMPSGLPGVFAGAALIFFAYQGFEEMVKLSEEAEKPETTIPRGLIAALVITTVLYLLVAVAAVSAVGFTSLASSPAPFAEVANTYLGGSGATLFTVIALFATANTVLLMLIASSRLAYGMAKRGSLPVQLAMVHRTLGTPWVAIVAVTVASLAFVLLGDIRVIAEITTFTLYVTFFVINAAVIALRFSSPKLPRPFRVPLSLAGIPITPVLGGVVCVFFLFQLPQSVLLIGTALLLVTLGISYVALQKGG
ncbi:MAG: APC family permease [Euryarchaeota archaeon]|nr:APC family permease [Euryarchaeota archaeon]